MNELSSRALDLRQTFDKAASIRRQSIILRAIAAALQRQARALQSATGRLAGAIRANQWSRTSDESATLASPEDAEP